MLDDIVIVGTLDDYSIGDFDRGEEFEKYKVMRQERLGLANAIESAGFEVVRTTRDWPRDDFVRKGDLVIDIFGYSSRFSEGGNIIPTSEFLLVSNIVCEGLGGIS